MQLSAIPLTVWRGFNETELRQFVSQDIIIYHSNRYFTFLKEATWEKISHFVDDDSFILDLSDTPVLDVRYKPQREIPPQFRNSTNYPAVPLTVWFKFNQVELRQFIGRDVIIYHNNRYFTFLKEATWECMSRLLDDDSFIIDLSDTPQLDIRYKEIPPQFRS